MNTRQVILEGELQKQSPKGFLGFHAWQTRYFMLYPDQILYFKEKADSVDEENALGYLLFDNISGVEWDKRSDTKFQISLAGVDRKFKLSASTSELATTWVHEIRTILSKRTKTAVPLASPSDTNTKFWKAKIHRTLIKHRQAILASETEISSPRNKDFTKTEEEKALILDIISKATTFKIFDDVGRKTLVDHFYKLTFQAKEVVSVQGKPSNLCYFVVKGSLQAKRDDGYEDGPQSNSLSSGRTSVADASSDALQMLLKSGGHPDSLQQDEISVGDWFGETCMLYDAPSTHTITCTQNNTECFVIERSAYKSMLTENSERKREYRIRAIKTHTMYLGKLSDTRINQISDLFEDVHYTKNQSVFYVNLEATKCAIVVSGTIQCQQTGSIYTTNDVLYEDCLVTPNIKYEDTYTVMSDKCHVIVLQKKHIALNTVIMTELYNIHQTSTQVEIPTLFDVASSNMTVTSTDACPVPTLSDLQLSASSYHNASANNTGLSAAVAATATATSVQDGLKTPVVSASDYPETVKEFTVIGTLGRGTFGHVQLVEHPTNGTLYALKAIRKAHVVKHNQVKHIVRERAIARLLNHPFIVKLHTTYRDNTYVYLLTEAVMGGEFFTLLRSENTLNETDSRFYAANVVCMYEYLHKYNIVYRDMKPENLLLTTDGYLKLTDFGFAKQTSDRCYTFCGTPDYLAPEIITGDGYTQGVDWWALGVLVYEMLSGYPPFYDEDLMQSYELMLANRIQFPSHFSLPLVAFLKEILRPKSSARLGSTNGSAEVKSHAWFAGIDWKGMEKQTLTPPRKIALKNKYDLSNFDPYEGDPEEDMDNTYVDVKNPNWDEVF